MELQIVGTNTEITPAIRRYIERKLGKLNRHMPGIMETKVEVSEEKTKAPEQHYLVRAIVSKSKAVFHGEERAEDAFIAIDRVADVLIRQLEHHKGKLYEKGRGVSLARGITSQDEPLESARVEGLEGVERTEAGKVVKVKRFVIQPMTEEDAITEMERLGHAFFLFLDSETKGMKVVYRRKDGDFGLIEPEVN
ncbi:MAG: ribosome-associated translation inhibitor RaiA [Dehalococcoidales bacterium]|nr:ribosome-associated translation inhibitor RaiA [Dehalococcoidales bacterium]